MGVDVHEDAAGHVRVQHAVGPEVEEARRAAPDRAAKKGWGVRVCLVEIAGDRPGIIYDPFAVDQHGHELLAADGYLVLFGEAAGLEFGIEGLENGRASGRETGLTHV